MLSFLPKQHNETQLYFFHHKLWLKSSFLYKEKILISTVWLPPNSKGLSSIFIDNSTDPVEVHTCS